MTHELRERHPLNGIGFNPLVISLRYRCERAGNEVLQISVVIDKDIPEKDFVWTMKRLLEDVRFEVQQHLVRPVATKETANV